MDSIKKRKLVGKNKAALKAEKRGGELSDLAGCSVRGLISWSETLE